MYDDYEDNLFGHDGRHKPNPFPDMLTEKGWGNSHGRLAYTSFNRQQDSNISEYAVSTIGFMPQGYVIIDRRTMPYDKENAIKVSKYRVAIPVRDFASHNLLTIRDQWELMNSRYVGCFDPTKNVKPRKDVPNIEDAYMKAEDEGRLDKFLSQFWDIKEMKNVVLQKLNQQIYEIQELENAANEGLRRFFKENFDTKRSLAETIDNCKNRAYDGNPLNVIERRLMAKYESVRAINERIRKARHRIKEFIEQRSLQL